MLICNIVPLKKDFILTFPIDSIVTNNEKIKIILYQSVHRLH